MYLPTLRRVVYVSDLLACRYQNHIAISIKEIDFLNFL